MNNFWVILLSLSSCISCYGQGNVENKSSLDTQPTMDLLLPTEYKTPQADFLIFNVNQKEGLFTGKIDVISLQKTCQYALLMGRIPPIGIVYYNKGYQTSSIQVFTTDFATDIKQVTLKSEKFKNVGDYENKRNQILSLKNTYIIEEESIGYNKFIYVLIQDVDSTNEERLFSKLTNLSKKVYKGDALDYYFQGFGRFDDKETFSSYVDANGYSLYRLKFYYSDLDKDVELGNVFTMSDCKRIIGRDYILKSYSAIRNEEYVLTWYQF